MRITIHDSIEELPAAVWERLGTGLSVFQQHAWFRVAPQPGRLRLLVAHSRGSPVALLPIYFEQAPAQHYYHSPRDLLCGFRERPLLLAGGLSRAALAATRDGPWYPAALSVCPYGYRGGLIARCDHEESAEVTAAVAAAADELCRHEGSRIALFYGLGSGDTALLAALAARGARSLVVGAHCNLPMVWPSLEAYFRDLGPRGRRLRSRHRQAEASGGWPRIMGIKPGRAFEPTVQEEAVELFCAAAWRHRDINPPVRLFRDLLGPVPFRRYLLAMPDAGGRMRSALLVLDHERILYPKLFGSRVRDDYFFLTYTKLVELAIANGSQGISYGGGSHTAKLLRGARLEWLTASALVYDEVLGELLTPLFAVYSPAKVDHFSGLARRFSVDHSAPEPPSFAVRTRARAGRVSKHLAQEGGSTP